MARSCNSESKHIYSPLNTSGTFGFAPVCPTGTCKLGITEVNMTEHKTLSVNITGLEYYVEDVRMDIH